MATPSPAEAARILEGGWSRVQELVNGLSEEDMTRPRTIGGGDWSAKDLIGHLATWEELALQGLDTWRRADPSEAEAAFATPGGVDGVNARAYERKRDWPLDRVRSETEETHRRLVAELRGMSEEEWASPSPFPVQRRKRLATFMGSVLGAPQQPFGHASAHIPDLERFVESLGTGGEG